MNKKSIKWLVGISSAIAGVLGAYTFVHIHSKKKSDSDVPACASIFDGAFRTGNWGTTSAHPFNGGDIFDIDEDEDEDADYYEYDDEF